MFKEALAIGEALGDPRVHGEALLASAWNHYHLVRPGEQAEAALRAAELLRSAGDLWNLDEALSLFQRASLHLGRLDGVAQFEEETEHLAQRLGHHGARMETLTIRGLTDWLVTADLDQYEAHVHRCQEVCAEAKMPYGSGFEARLALASLWRGEWEKARDCAQDAAVRELRDPTFMGGEWSALFLCESFVGHQEIALGMLEERRSGLPRVGQPNHIGAWTMLLAVIEGLAVLGEREAAAELYALALELVETGTIVSQATRRLAQTVAGIAAASGRQWDQAETHYQTALRQAHEIPFRSEQPEVRRWHAQMLLDRMAYE